MALNIDALNFVYLDNEQEVIDTSEEGAVTTLEASERFKSRSWRVQVNSPLLSGTTGGHQGFLKTSKG
jgi:hypothetical protein